MNSKKSMRQKRTKTGLKTKTQDGNAEIFVLPPELLQKLGINLGKIDSNQECPTIVSSESDVSSLNNAPATAIKKNLQDSTVTQKEQTQDTSILETANLMKKSVFLSPTFVVNGINSSPDHLEISNVLEHERVEINDSIAAVDELQVTNTFQKITMENVPNHKLDGLTVNSKASNNIEYANIANHHQIDTSDRNMVSLSNRETGQFSISTDDVINLETKLRRLISKDDHLDEAYSSDCSNSNLGPSGDSLNHIPDIHSINVNIPLESSNKISIISEEILNPSQIKELKTLHSPRLSDLIPLSINSLITPNKIGECGDILKGDILLDFKRSENSPCKLIGTPYPAVCKSMDTLVIFDEEGNVIETDGNTMAEINKSDEFIENMSELSNQESFNKIIDPVIQTHDNNIGVSIDFVVTDIDMHLKENEDILEKFVNEITSNDNEILAKIERSEEECFNKTNTNETRLAINSGATVALNYDESGSNNLLSHCHNESDKVKDDWCIANYRNHKNSSSDDKKINNYKKENKSTDLMEVIIERDVHTPINKKCEESKNEGLQNNTNQKTESNNVKDPDQTICNKIEANKSIQCMDVDLEPIKDTGNTECRKVNHQNNCVQKSSTCIKSSNNVHIDMDKTTDCALKKPADANKPDIAVERVKEIAMYLAQFAENHSEGRKLRNKSDEKLKIPNKKAKQNVLTSKLFKQGVEKPGGPKDLPECYTIPKVSKTYINHKKSTKKCVASTAIHLQHRPPTFSSVEETQSTQLIYKEDEKNESVIENCKIRTQEFCLCGDFGRLAYYDSDCIYEHIHFWEHKNIACNREMIFSIYNDIVDFLIGHNDTTSLEEGIEANPSEDVHSICWYSFVNKVKNKEFQNYEKSSIMIGQEQDINLPDILSKESVTDSVNKKPNDLECNVETNKESLKTCVPVAVMNNQGGELNSFESEISNTSIEKKVKVEPVSSGRDNESSSKQIIIDKKKIASVTEKKKEELIITNDVDKEINTDKNKLTVQSKPDSSDRNMSSQQINESKREIAEGPIIANAIENDKNTDNQKKTNKCNTELSNENILKQDKDEPQHELRVKKVKKLVECDVCRAVLSEKEWEDHISNKHCYIAWRSGSSIDLEDSELKTKLQEKLKHATVLKCPFCDAERKYIKKFLSHVKKCIQTKNLTKALLNNSSTDVTIAESTEVVEVETSTALSDDLVVKCAVCQEELKNSEWIDHNAIIHHDNAWKDGETPLKRSYVPKEDVDKVDNDEPSNKKSVRCDVCQAVLSEKEWEDHISNEHCYIAWRSGSSIDLEDSDLKTKLRAKLKDTNVLKCPFCDTERKYIKKFLSHVKKCLDAKYSTESSLNYSLNDVTMEENTDSTELQTKNTLFLDDPAVKCAICQLELKDSEWIDHIAVTHNYIAWKDGEIPLDVDDEEGVRYHLTLISRKYGELKCNKCGLCRKYAKLYMQHVQQCKGECESEQPSPSKELNVKIKDIKLEPPENKTPIKCGVCEQVINSDWIEHIEKNHAYLAWKSGDPPLDVDDEDEVKQHLYNITKQHGKLACNKCGLVRKYVKPYLTHIQKCTGKQTKDFVFDKSNDGSIDDFYVGENCNLVKCGVCLKQVPSRYWIQHIQKIHEYLAWIEGETFDLNDEMQVQRHLDGIVTEVGSLVCSKCGVVRKYASSYLQHWKNCNLNLKAKDEGQNTVLTDQNELVCGVCSEHMEPKMWKDHKMNKHYNVAWAVGNPPVNYRDPNVVDALIREYRAWNKKLVCKICGINRVSCIGFYAHIITCGKTEEEIDFHKNVCKVCGKKYLYIYESQHMTWHREQELAKERRKLREIEEREKKKKCEVDKAESPGPRRAAQKAKNVIEKYKIEISQSAFTCSTCYFGADTKKELDSHTCMKSEIYDSDTDESVNLEDMNKDESEDSEVDHDISDDEESIIAKRRNRKCVPACANVPRFPIELPNVNSYLVKSGVEFSEFHFTSEDLFPEWQSIVSEQVPEENMSNYMPSLEESCQVHLSDSWNTLKRFETRNIRGQNQCLFVGGSIQCVAWAPPCKNSRNGGDQYLAVIAHRGSDAPKIQFEEVAAGPGLIQIWDFAQFAQPAKFVLGLAHDYGVAWAMDWCPSGARYILNESVEENSNLRLGLLAVAFSNGSAYIFSVPYPATIVNKDKIFHKLKPVAELRLTIGNDRKIYQATSITWSQQKSHDTILIGYANGSTAYFDLKTESPFLKTKEDDVTILYPYHDVRPHNSCVLGVGIYPSMSADTASVVCSASTTGAALVSRPSVRPARQQTHMPCAGACFEPHWPSAVLCIDDTGTASMVNELEWWGGGRRLGGRRAAAACCACARLALHVPPLLRVLRPHPARTELKKHNLAILQMAPLGKKRKLQNDELQTKVEPITYEDSVKKYGIELNIDKSVVNRASKAPEQFPDRFPLADVISMAFCPAAAHHHKLAVATHAGIIFLLLV